MARLSRLRRQASSVSEPEEGRTEPEVDPADDPADDPATDPETAGERSAPSRTRRLRGLAGAAGRGSASATRAAAAGAVRGTAKLVGSVRKNLPRPAPDNLVWTLTQAAHPRQGVLTAFGVAVAAALIERPAREIVVVFVTVLIGQTIMGWHNDLVDRHHDRRHEVEGKPIADGRLASGTAWFALACAVLLLIPVSVSTGINAGTSYLLAVAAGVLSNLLLRRGVLSWVPWAASYALLPAYVAFGGWGGNAEGQSPTLAMTLLVAALGVGVHFLRALFGLVADHQDGWSYAPLRLSIRLGAPRMLLLTGGYLALVAVAIAIVGSTVGLTR